MSWLDLHVHSVFSNDGSFTPKELMSLCVKRGVRTTAIADHNTIKGAKEGRYAARSLGVTLIPAIEIDCIYEGINFHVLGYYIDLEEKKFLELSENVQYMEQEASKKRMELVKDMGIHFSYYKAMQIASCGIVTGEVIAEAALQEEKNKTHEIFGDYFPGGKKSESPLIQFYWDVCSQGKPAYVPVEYISFLDAVDLIKKSGGIAVLAHPGNNIKENNELLEKMMAQKIEGIEAYSSYHTPEQTLYYKRKAQQFHKIITCGSDFHGKTKPQITLGHVDCENEESNIIHSLMEKRDNIN